MRPNIPALTSLRFFAAAFVVIFHYPAKFVLFPLGVGDFGYEAVTFFYVLSGFILTYTHGTESGMNVSIGKFFASRLTRICPAYYLALLLSAPFFVASLVKNWSLLPGAILVPTMLQSWTPPFALAWNSPAWSLSNEIFFYALFPLIWVCSIKVATRNFLAMATSAIVAVAIFRYCYPAGRDDDWHSFLNYFPLFNLPQFVLGVCLGSIFIRKGVCSRSLHLAILVTSILAVVLILALKQDYKLLANSAVLCVVFSGLIFGIIGLPWKAMSWSGLVILGEASYALYILHFPIWLWWDRIFRVLLEWNLPVALDFILYSLFTVSISVATLYLIEKPVRRFRFSLLARGA